MSWVPAMGCRTTPQIDRQPIAGTHDIIRTCGKVHRNQLEIARSILKDFGAEVFQNGTRDLQLIPMDLPAGPDYVVGPGDGLSINLWGGTTQRIYRVVDREGRVSLPE